jgi:hypothetical protein
MIPPNPFLDQFCSPHASRQGNRDVEFVKESLHTQRSGVRARRLQEKMLRVRRLWSRAALSPRLTQVDQAIFSQARSADSEDTRKSIPPIPRYIPPLFAPDPSEVTREENAWLARCERHRGSGSFGTAPSWPRRYRENGWTGLLNVYLRPDQPPHPCRVLFTPLTSCATSTVPSAFSNARQTVTS